MLLFLLQQPSRHLLTKTFSNKCLILSICPSSLNKNSNKGEYASFPAGYQIFNPLGGVVTICSPHPLKTYLRGWGPLKKN